MNKVIIRTIKFRFIARILILFSLMALWSGIQIIGDSHFDVQVQQAREGDVFYLDKKLSLDPLVYVDGRLYFPLESFVKSIGGSVKETDDGYSIKCGKFSYVLSYEDDEVLSKQMYTYDDEPYIYIYDVGQLFHLAVVFDSKSNKVMLYNRQMPVVPTVSDDEAGGKAYLRLEDLCAEGSVNPNASEYMEKIRTIADYLYSKGQSYYAAWIPLYVNPPKGVVNDLTKDFNFYNADFIYTLDYIVGHNGHIVLHGYTHQYGDDISGVGVEFGKDCPYSAAEVEERMKEAKEVAQRLGFEDNMFNFPHYCSTKEQLKIAEKYFDVIYQQSYYTKCMGKIYRRRGIGHDTLYVPTPIGYVPTIGDLPNVLQAIDDLPSDQITSLFVHPYVDFKSIKCTTEKGERKFYYDENGVFPQLVKKVTEKGLAFSTIDID